MLILALGACVGPADEIAVTESDTGGPAYLQATVTPTGLAIHDTDAASSDTDSGSAAYAGPVSGLGVCPAEATADDIVCAGFDYGNERGAELFVVALGTGQRTNIALISGLEIFTTNGMIAIGDDLFACARSQVTRVSPLDGSYEESGLPCSSVAEWHGEIAVLRGGGRDMSAYATWSDVLAGTADHEVAIPGSNISRFTIDGDRAIGAWHSTDHFVPFDATDGTTGAPVSMEGFDTYIWGMDVVNDEVLVVDDGRRGDSTGPLLVSAFDKDTGAARWRREVGEWGRDSFFGLVCGCPSE